MLFPQRLADRLKQQVKVAFRALGLEVRRSRDLPPPPPLCSEPLEVVSRRYAHDLVALKCPLAKCVEFNGFSLSPEGWHPLVQAAVEYIETGVRRYEGSSLERFYATWQPRQSLEALNGSLSGPAILERHPAYAKHTPWSSRTPEESAARMARIIEIENRASGDASLGPSDGFGLHGPVSVGKGRIEYGRLVDLVDSIRRNGYSRSNGDVTIAVLNRAGRFRHVILHGHHRAAALAALGHEHMPAIPEVLVERHHVDHWPGVYRNVWSREEALVYFDHLFNFDSLEWARQHRLCP